jgi:DNA-nicking Smr family endonuclease
MANPMANPLLPDDISLFLEQVGDAVPLPKQNYVEPFRRRPPPRPLPRPADQDRNAFNPTLLETDVVTEDLLEFARPGVQRRLLQELRRGQIAPQLELDLHGLSVAYAQETLDAFLKECQRRKLRCVRIIHGKGSRSADGQSILKCKVNYWLRCYDAVLAFSSTPRWDGGSGAAYVLLRNSRKNHADKKR